MRIARQGSDCAPVAGDDSRRRLSERAELAPAVEAQEALGMSKVAGIHHRDLAPIPIEQRARFSQLFSRVPRTRFQVYEDRAVLLAFGYVPDHSLPGHLAVGAETGNVLGWDGRLDNRDDLLKRFANRLGEERNDPSIALALYETAGLE